MPHGNRVRPTVTATNGIRHRNQAPKVAALSFFVADQRFAVVFVLQELRR